MNHGQLYYTAAAGEDKIVCTGRALLIGIIIGADVGSSVIEISDSPTDGDGNVKIYLAGDTLGRNNYMKINAVFEKGITMDITSQTHVTLIYKPLN